MSSFPLLIFLGQLALSSNIMSLLEVGICTHVYIIYRCVCLYILEFSLIWLIYFKNLNFRIVILKGSVWSSLPPINTSSSDQTKPIILTVASMDSASFFRDKSLGADSPISVCLPLDICDSFTLFSTS